MEGVGSTAAKAGSSPHAQTQRRNSATTADRPRPHNDAVVAAVEFLGEYLTKERAANATLEALSIVAAALILE